MMGIAMALGRRPAVVFLLGTAGLATLILLHLALGQHPLPPTAVLSVLQGQGSELAGHIVTQVRAPRAVVAALVGALLGIAGAMMQTITRNELADPGLLGVTPAAVLAVVTTLVASGGNAATGILPLTAFAGALAGGLVVYRIGWAGGSDRLRLVLTGVIFGTVLGAATTVLLLRSGDVTGAVYRWVIGSLHATTWIDARVAIFGALVAIPAAFAVSRTAGLLALGDDAARGRGLVLGRARAVVFGAAALATAAAVSVAGALAFLGLVAPHLARRVLPAGVPTLICGSALAGALVLLCADVLATTLTFNVDVRGVQQRAAVPVGALVAIAGAPLLLGLLRREGDR